MQKVPARGMLGLGPVPSGGVVMVNALRTLRNKRSTLLDVVRRVIATVRKNEGLNEILIDITVISF
jgi:hypothetical protein